MIEYKMHEQRLTVGVDATDQIVLEAEIVKGIDDLHVFGGFEFHFGVGAMVKAGTFVVSLCHHEIYSEFSSELREVRIAQAVNTRVMI